MKHAMGALFLLALCGCTSSGTAKYRGGDPMGMDSFALAARYGTPSVYWRQGEYLQLNCGSTATGCRLIVLIDQEQRVAGWASSGAMCGP